MKTGSGCHFFTSFFSLFSSVFFPLPASLSIFLSLMMTIPPPSFFPLATHPAMASTSSLWPPSFLPGIASIDYHSIRFVNGSGATFGLKRKASDDETDICKNDNIITPKKIARIFLSSDAATTARQTVIGPRFSPPSPRCHRVLSHENHANFFHETRQADLEVPLPPPHLAIKHDVGFHNIVNAAPQQEAHRIRTLQKLHLVLDIDHTLLNSARFAKVSPVEEDYLRSITSFLVRQSCQSGGEVEVDGQAGAHLHLDGGLHRLERLRIWTKLRPFVRQFLSAASEMYEMWVYTMGNRLYADAMAKLLDPDGSLFGGRIISRSESRCPRNKDLDVTKLSDTATVILDDTLQVWPRHKPNVVVMERYHFFESSPRCFSASIPCMSELRTDESEHDGALSDALSLLRQVHAAYFDGEYVDASGRRRKYGVGGGHLQDSNIIHGKDVREILREMRKSVLSGCKIVFSRVFPTNLSHPNTHPCWRLSEDLGAKCTTELDETVTHVVALDGGTDKARWAIREGRHLVHPKWIDAAFFCRKRPDESCFSLHNPLSTATTTHFTKTVGGGHAPSPPAVESQSQAN